MFLQHRIFILVLYFTHTTFSWEYVLSRKAYKLTRQSRKVIFVRIDYRCVIEVYVILARAREWELPKQIQDFHFNSITLKHVWRRSINQLNWTKLPLGKILFGIVRTLLHFGRTTLSPNWVANTLNYRWVEGRWIRNHGAHTFWPGRHFFMWVI